MSCLGLDVSVYTASNMCQGKLCLHACTFVRMNLVLSRFDNSYITWINNDLPVWTLMGAGMAADPLTEASLIRVVES